MHKTPVIPAVVIGVIAAVILVANAGIPQVFTAVASVAIIMIYVAYLLVTVPLLIKRLRGQWPDPSMKDSGYIFLGRWGLPINVLAVLWGALMALNMAWPREEVYGEGWLAWIAFIFIGIVALGGLLWYGVRGRYHIGTLPEHMVKNLEEAP